MGGGIFVLLGKPEEDSASGSKENPQPQKKQALRLLQYFQSQLR
jgi:hypothetical protein